MNISKTDIDLIKEIFTLATSVDDTFVRLDSGSVLDMNGNEIVGMSNGMAILADAYIPDTISPELLNFTLDLDMGEILLVFSETVNTQTLNFSAVTLHNDTSSETFNMYRLTEGVTSLRNFTDVTIFLNDQDLNVVKSLLTLGTTVSDTYLSFTSNFIEDMNMNEISPAETVQAYNVVPDISGPLLRSFNLNLSTDILSLTFSETVSAPSFNQTAITFLNNQDGLVQHTLTDSYVNPVIDSTEIFVQLSTNDVNEIKRLSLATSLEDTYLAITSDAITDTMENRVVAVPPSQALNVSVFYPDEVDPILLEFNFNLSSGEITLTFSETVNASTFNVTGFTLQAVANASDLMTSEGVYQLTPVSTSSANNSHILVISIADFDLNSIKQDTTLVVLNSSTFLSLSGASIRDMNNNPIVAISSSEALAVSMFTPDTVSPELVLFNLYLERGTEDLILELVFSETINSSSVQPTGFTFSNSPNTSNSTQIFRLTGGLTSTVDSTLIMIMITPTDLESIRQLDFTMLLTSPETSYLAISALSLYDMAGNVLEPISLDDAFNINGSFADLSPPMLDSFILDLDRGTIFIQFTEPVFPTSLVPTRLSIHSGREVGFNSSLGEFITLTNATNVTTTPEGSLLSLEIIDNDLNAVKLLTMLAVSRASTFISFDRGLVLDYSLNEAFEVTSNNATRAIMYIRDETGPRLEVFDFDLAAETITLSFSETINSSSVNVREITFQNSDRNANSFYTLTNSVVLSNDSTRLVILLSEEDSNGIKALDRLLTSEFDSYIAIDREALRDMAGNELIDVSPDSALAVFNYTADTIRPQILRYVIDLNAGQILMTFDETVNERTLDASQITLVDAFNQTLHNLTLRNGISNFDVSHIVNITLSRVDLNELKRLPLCTGIDDCYLTFTQDLVLDAVNLPVFPLTSNNSDVMRDFIPDTTRPELEQLVLVDFEQELVVLQFSETLNVDTLNFSSISFRSLFADPISSVMLTGGSVPSENTSRLEISLSQDDLDSLKLNSMVCAFRGNCYISFTEELVEDMNSNIASPILDVFPGFLVTSFIRDETNPSLIAFDLNLAQSYITLDFSEPINLESINFPRLILQGVRNASNTTDPVMFLVERPFNVTRVTSRRVVLQLSSNNIESLKASRYFSTNDTTFISVSAESFNDVAFLANQNNEISPDDALPVRIFTADEDGPILSSFSIDYSTNRLVLMFNEPVLPDTFNFTGITFSSVPFPSASDEVYTLTGGRIANVLDSDEGLMNVIIELNMADATALKASQTLAFNVNNTFIALQNETVLNSFGEPNMPVQGLGSTDITVDLTDLRVEGFSLDMDLGLLILSFNDVVSSNSFDPRGVILQNAADAEDSFRYQLTDNSVNLSPDGFSLRIQIGDNDLNNIKAINNLAGNESDTFITLRASTVEDVFGENVISVTNTNGIQVSAGEFTADTTLPTLTNFTLDLTQGILRLTFSEGVNFSSFRVEDVVIQDNNNVTNDTITELLLSLNNESLVVPSSLTELTIMLQLSDLNTIKQFPQFATDVSNTFVAIMEGALVDFADNGFNMIDGLPAAEVIPDTISPQLLSYQLDLNESSLILTFSETVNGTSLDVSGLTFQGEAIFRAGNSYTLMSSQAQLDNSPVIFISLSTEDTNSIKQLPDVASSLGSTYLVVGENAILDTSDNPVVPISDIMALGANRFILDEVNPRLESFGLNLTTDILSLFFSETVDVQTLDATQITLHSSRSSTASSISLTGALTESLNGPILLLALSTPDLNFIKEDESFGTDSSNTFLSLTAGTVRDVDGNEVEAISATQSLQVDASSFFPDATPPILNFFEFDSNTGVLTLNFSEVVRVSTFNATGLIFLNATRIFVEYRLTNASVVGGDNLASIEVQLSDTDQNAIKTISNLGSKLENTFLIFESIFIQDMDGNNIEEIMPINAIMTTVYIEDETSPALTDFSVNLNTSQLTLTFSETIDISSFNVSGVTLLSSANSSASQVMLMTSTTSQEDSTEVTIFLSRSDSNALKRESDIATNTNNTFISIRDIAVMDVNGNLVRSLAPENSFTPSEYVPDEISPVLEFFTYDADQGQLLLTFSETIAVDSIDVTEFQLQNGANFSISNVSYAIASATIVGSNSHIVTIQLPVMDQNAIKQILSLAKRAEDTFISFTELALTDTSNNSVVGVDQTSATAVQENGFVPDETSPQLNSFDLDMNNGELTLFFSETVDPQNFRVDAITLQGSELDNENNTYMLTSGSQASTELSPVVTITLSAFDLNNIKLDGNIATDTSNIALSIGPTAVHDVVVPPQTPNFVEPVVLPTGSFNPDTTPPVLLSWIVNFDESELVFNFNEAVDSSTLMFESMTLQSVMNATSLNNSQYESLTPTNGTSLNDDGLQISIRLSEGTTNTIKQMLLLLRDLDSSFLSIQPTFIEDLNGNNVTTISTDNALMALAFFNDTMMPRLRDFWLDLDTGNLTLSFSETVNASSVYIPGIGIQNQANTSEPGGLEFILTSGSVVSENGPVLVLSITRDDLNELKRLGIARNARTTWLTLDSMTLSDVDGNNLVPLLDAITSRGIRRRNYSPDITGPVLEMFNVDFTDETMLLFFDETVRANTLDVTEITLLSSRDNFQRSMYTLTDSSSVVDINYSNVTVILSTFDLDNIKIFSSLATFTNNTFISITNITVRDMRANYNFEILPNQAQLVSEYTSDTTSPTLNQYSLNLTSDELTLQFSETINVSSFDPTQLTLYENFDGSGATFTLTGGMSRYRDRPNIIILDLLNDDDLNVIKQLNTLAISSDSTHLAITNNTVADMDGNEVVEIPASRARPVMVFVEDTVPPELLHFDLDMDASTLTLYFSETVNSLTFDPLAATLQDAREADDSYQLTGGLTESLNDSTILVNISKTDLDALKQNTSLVTSNLDSYISFTEFLIADMNGNRIVPIIDGEALVISNYTADTTAPVLIEWELDMDEGRVTMTFSETVNAYQFDPSQITFQAASEVQFFDESYTLSGGNSSQENITVITFDILFDLTVNPDDLNTIKNLTLLATAINNSFVSITQNLIEDMNGNRVVAILNGEALQVSNFTEDTTPPSLHAFDIDMDSGEIFLTFDETLNRETLNITIFSLQSEPNQLVPTQINETFLDGRVTLEVTRNLTNAAFNYTLTDGTAVGEWDDQVLRFQLSDRDLNRIKRLDLCTELNHQNDCFLVFSSEAVEDMNGNMVIPVGTFIAERARFFTEDRTPPSLGDFIAINFNTRRVLLEFSETINVSSFDPTQITVQRWTYNDSGINANVAVFRPYQLTGGLNITEISDTTLEFTLTSLDTNIINRRPELCTEGKNCFVRFTERVLRDMASNLAEPLVDDTVAEPFEFATDFFADRVPPVLMSYEVHLDNGSVVLTFDETVSFSDLDVRAIQFVNRGDENATEMYRLRGDNGRDTTIDFIYVQFYLRMDDIIELKAIENLLISRNSTWLENGNDLIEDASGNDAFVRNSLNRLQATVFTGDFTSPRLIDFRLRFDTKTLILESNEPIYLPSVDPTLITLASGRDLTITGFSSFTLTNGTVSYLEPENFQKRRVAITLTDDDLFVIQLDSAIASDPASTFLSIESGAFTDMFENNVISIQLNESLQIDPNNLITDSIAVALISFTIDMNLGTLDLTFDDTVATSTFNPIGIEIQNSDNPENITAVHRLTDGSSTTSRDGYFLTVILSKRLRTNIFCVS